MGVKRSTPLRRHRRVRDRGAADVGIPLLIMLMFVVVLVAAFAR